MQSPQYQNTVKPPKQDWKRCFMSSEHQFRSPDCQYCTVNAIGASYEVTNHLGIFIEGAEHAMKRWQCARMPHACLCPAAHARLCPKHVLTRLPALGALWPLLQCMCLAGWGGGGRPQTLRRFSVLSSSRGQKRRESTASPRPWLRRGYEPQPDLS